MTDVDKFKIIETAPFFKIASTGSYDSKSFKNVFKLKSKNPLTGSTVITSGILNCNLKTVPTSPINPTILRYNNNSAGPSFVWSGVTWTLDNTLPNYSYSANAVELISTVQNLVPNNASLISVAIGTKVTSIGFLAFYDCTALTSIIIPNSVTSIGFGAFQNCTGLTSITISTLVTSIGQSAFYNCNKLTSIIIPPLVTSISVNAFNNCTALTSVTIPDSVTSINNTENNTAFQNCTNLKSATISKNNSLGIISPGQVDNFYGATYVNIYLP